MSNQHTVAIVDDDAYLRDALENLIRSSGLVVLKFAAAEDLLDRPCGASIDVIVTDFQMPGMDGIELIRVLRAAGDLTPVILMTAHEQPGLRERAMAAGAADFLPKPFDADILLGAIESALARRRHGSNGLA